MLRRLAFPSISVASALRHHATAPPSIAQAAAVVGDASTAKAAAAAEAGIPEGISAAQAAARDEKLDEKQRDFIGSFRSKLDKATEEELMGVVSTETEIPARTAIPEVKLVKRGQERLPSWLKLQLPKGPRRRGKYNKIRASLRAKGLATVCEEANCPNIGECWGGAAEDGSGEGTATATIMMMGDTCTRACRFCAVKTAKCPAPLDPNEPENTGAAVAAMGVDYIVVTMVDRDDLADGGAAHVRKTMQAIKEKSDNKVLVECLAGDFHGKPELVELVATSGLDCYAHNIECVERITPRVRDRRASYRQSLRVLESARAAKADLLTKSSIMLGLGEEEAEIRQTLRDLRTAGVRALTLGQYLQPTSTRMKVSRYAHPDEFDMWKEEAEAMGFLYCASGPMVRSSYRAGEYYLSNLINKQRSDAEDAAKAAAQASAAAVE